MELEDFYIWQWDSSNSKNYSSMMVLEQAELKLWMAIKEVKILCWFGQTDKVRLAVG